MSGAASIGPKGGDYHAQNGEDRILAGYCDRLGIETGYFVEFGAWDGKTLSNTYHFYDRKNWRGCYIEGDPERYGDLTANIDAARADLVQAFVAPDGDNSLDAILTRVGAPQDFDILSVDIDSDDYRVWQGVHAFRPKLVVTEYNPTIPNSCFYVQDPGAHIGNSARAMAELGTQKGYVAACATPTNLIFVRADLAEKLDIEPRDLNALRDDMGHIFYGYDGSCVVTGNLDRSPWTGKSLRLTLDAAPVDFSQVRRIVRLWLKGLLSS